VAFGAPVPLSSVVGITPEARTTALAEMLMARLRRAVPVLPVPLVCLALRQADGPVARGDLLARVAQLGDAMPDVMRLSGAEQALATLLARGVVQASGDSISIVPGEGPMVDFYANSIAHHLDDHAAVQEQAKIFAAQET
jgi:glycerol-3-phosphate O-acyltransferase